MSRIPTFVSFLKQSKRAAREAELGARQRALPDRRYGVILADPPWKFEVWSAEGMSRSADNHYPTSVVDAICATDVPAIAADDCVLFLWATAPMLPEAMLVMAKWGFAYKSHLIWDKKSGGHRLLEPQPTRAAADRHAREHPGAGHGHAE